MVFCPLGALKASWSKVSISPPAFSILARAVSVNLIAQICTEECSCHASEQHFAPLHLQLGNFQYSDVIGNGAHHNSNFLLAICRLHLAHLQEQLR